MKAGRMLKKWDKAVLLAGLLAGLAALLLWRFAQREEPACAEVYVDGQLQGRYSLFEERTVVLDKNTIWIGDGSAVMVHADCPDQICVRTGTVRLTSQMITCLPNRVVVRITGGDGGGGEDVDTVAR